MKPITVMIMAGGTGGHVFPALAVAQELRQRGHTVVWMGTHRGIEAEVVPAAGIVMHWIDIAGLRGNGVLGWLKAPFKIIGAVKQAWNAHKEAKPDVALGMGGFVAGPGGMAAVLRRIPLVIHDQNAVAGLTNRLLHRVSAKTLEAFPATFDDAEKVHVVGNPVREEIVALAPKTELGEPPRVLVVGGSLGALALNELMPKALAIMGENAPIVWHQTGRNKFDSTVADYQQQQIPVLEEMADLWLGRGVYVSEFINDMAEAYQWADVVICRSGAMTVFEIAAAGKPALFVPYPHAVDDHQWHNAQYLAEHEAALVVRQEALSGEKLAKKITKLINNPERVLKMAQAAYARRIVDAASTVATVCEEEVEHGNET
jgi:UDP-N-acetylglucosamine--N-acetylmuramyl-(pentapeptide) pyrophosphoryl-undecaprenol N-acetylglucosamine transferase